MKFTATVLSHFVVSSHFWRKCSLHHHEQILLFFYFLLCLLCIYLKFLFLCDLCNRNILMTLFRTFHGDRHHQKNLQSVSDPKPLRKNSRIHVLHKTLVTAFSWQVNLRCCVQYHLYGQISWITTVLFFYHSSNQKFPKSNFKIFLICVLKHSYFSVLQLADSFYCLFSELRWICVAFRMSSLQHLFL